MSLYQSADGKWGVDYRDEWGRDHHMALPRPAIATRGSLASWTARGVSGRGWALRQESRHWER